MVRPDGSCVCDEDDMMMVRQTVAVFVMNSEDEDGEAGW